MHDLADYIVHDLVIGIEKVVAAHAGLARNSRGNDDDVRVRGIGVIVRSEDGGVALLDRHGLEQIETFSLGDAFHDVDENDIGELFGGDPVGGSGAYVSGSDYGYLIAHEVFPQG